MLIMDSDSGGSSITSMLSSNGLGSLAGLAGLSGGGSSNSALIRTIGIKNYSITAESKSYQSNVLLGKI